MIRKLFLFLFINSLLFSFSVEAKSTSSEKIKIIKESKKKGRFLAKYNASDSLSKGDVIYLHDKANKKVATAEVLKVKGKKFVFKLSNADSGFSPKGLYHFSRIQSSKKFYFGGGASYNMNSYGDLIIENTTSRLPFGFQGNVYYNLFPNNLIGMIASLDMDIMTMEAANIETSTTYLHMDFAAATKHFFSKKLGRGIFAGAGVGFGGVQGKVEVEAAGNSTSTVTELELGPSFFVEGGYGIKAESLSIQPQLGFNYKLVNSQGYSTIKLGVNVMY
jgi:hypothetical protein